MRKIIALVMMLMIVVNVFASKLTKDENTNNTYAQTQSFTEWDIIKFDEQIGASQCSLITKVQLLHVEGKVDDKFVEKFLKVNDDLLKARESFADYKHILWDVEDGKVAPNKYSRRTFIYRYNQVVDKYNKLLKLYNEVN